MEKKKAKMTDRKYKYIIASDLDGTLIHGADELSSENFKAISELYRRDICFAPCSGRTIGEMPECVLKHPDIRYYIGADGSVIWDKLTGKFIELGMTKEEAGRLFDLLYEYDTLLTVRIGGVCYSDARMHKNDIMSSYKMSKNYINFANFYIKPAEDFESLIRQAESVEMVCVFFKNRDELEEFRRRAEDDGAFKVTASEPENLEIHSVRAGKGSGLRALAEILGVPIENTIAVGDSKNDLDMLCSAGLSLAMDNASDEVKSAANKTICHYKEHSAKYILEHFFEGEKSR